MWRKTARVASWRTTYPYTNRLWAYSNKDVWSCRKVIRFAIFSLRHRLKMRSAQPRLCEAEQMTSRRVKYGTLHERAARQEISPGVVVRTLRPVVLGGCRTCTTHMNTKTMLLIPLVEHIFSVCTCVVWISKVTLEKCRNATKNLIIYVNCCVCGLIVF